MTMPNLPPHWAEGMALTPQHLQAFSRHVADRGSTAFAPRPYTSGISALVIDEEALRTHRFRIDRLEAQLEDGTLVRFPGSVEVPSRDLKEALAEAKGSLQVYLAIPELRAGTSNVASADEAGVPRRFVVRDHEVDDENGGGVPRHVAFRLLAGRLLIEGENQDGYDVIPIAKVRVADDRESAPELDPQYVPPVNRLNASAPLARVFDGVVKRLSTRAKSLGDRLAGRPITFQDQDGAATYWKLHVVNANLATLSVLARAEGVHPFDAYLGVARLVGELGIFRNDHVAMDLPAYDPARLFSVFQAAAREVSLLLEAILPVYLDREPFEPQPNGLRCQLKRDWFQMREGLYIGVDSDLDAEAVRAHVDQLCLATAEDMPRIQSQVLPGIEYRFEESPPSQLPRRDGRQYWRVISEGDYWPHTPEEQHSCALVLFGGGASDPSYSYELFVVRDGESQR